MTWSSLDGALPVPERKLGGFLPLIHEFLAIPLESFCFGVDSFGVLIKHAQVELLLAGS